MAIPGLRPSYEVRAKVRTGKKNERGFPQSTDYFICDDPEFQRVTGGKQVSELRVFLPYQSGADCFRTGLEQWAGQMLVCYAKGDQLDGTDFALRKASMKQKGREVNLLDGFNVLSDRVVGNERRQVECLSRDCPMMKSKDCKPMGRLDFWIDGVGREGGVYRLETKSWNGIENIERTLLGYSDLRGVPFVLRVAFTQQGDKRFPELTLEAEVKIDNAQDVELADALVQLQRLYDSDEENGDTTLKAQLCVVLDLTNPGWRENPAFIERLKQVGAVEASRGVLEKHLD